MEPIEPPDRPLCDEEADPLLDVVRAETGNPLAADFDKLFSAARRRLTDLLRPVTAQEAPGPQVQSEQRGTFVREGVASSSNQSRELRRWRTSGRGGCRSRPRTGRERRG
jgi:hypothetical protein